MRKTEYLMATAAVSMIAGVLAVYLFSTTGYSLSSLGEPAFYGALMGSAMLPAIASLALTGAALGACFSGARFLGRLQAAGFGAICALVPALIGSVFFWDRITSYTILAFGLFAGMLVAALLSSNARGTKFSVGFDHAKTAILVMAAVAFIGTFAMVSADAEGYRGQMVSAISGFSSAGAGEVDDAAIRAMVEGASPKATWDEFLVQVNVTDYGALSAGHQAVVRDLYQNYSRDYDAAVAVAVGETRQRLDGGTAATELIIESVGFMKTMLDNIALLYAFVIASMLLLAETALIAPAAGITSYVAHLPLPAEAQPQPKGDVLKVRWTGE